MATESQIKANRKNAQKSTGPRTKEGKEAVSQNATKHGLCSCKNVIRSESQLEYDVFYEEMIADLSPAGAMELMLAERIVNLSWRLKRAEVFQNAVIESMLDSTYDLSFNSYIRARNEAKEGDMSLQLGIAIRRDFANDKILEQLLIYEKRIESSLYKATAELRKVQKMRRKEEETALAEVHLRKESEGHTEVDGSETIDEGREAMEDGRDTGDELREIIDDGGCTMEEGRDTRNETRETNLVKQSQFGSGLRLPVQYLNTGYSTLNADENIRLRSEETTP